jgi:peptide-methionine (S)-S-oxide reductase
MKTAFLALAALLATACDARAGEPGPSSQPAPMKAAAPAGSATAIFAGGCFWCSESDFEHLKGVLGAVSGYSGGKERNPTYDQVGHGRTGHAEVVEVTYDPKQVSYAQLVEFFFRHIDPTQTNGQFCDHGPQYRSAVFYANDAEKQVALAAKEKAAAILKAPIATEVVARTDFWMAEDYHQDFYKKDAGHYRRYRTGCGRDARVQELWGTNGR